jgi:hypothetical protein
VRRPRRQLVGEREQLAEHAVPGAERVDALLRPAEVGAPAVNLDVGDQEADLRGVDREARRLDVDRKVAAGDLPARDSPGNRPHAD